MAALGARLIQSDSTIKTATQQESEDTVANSVLSLCCDNVSAAYERALTWAQQFANVRGDISVELSTEFTKFSIDAQELTALIEGRAERPHCRRAISGRACDWPASSIQKKDDGIQEEIDQNPPPASAHVQPERRP
jgi:hypothetical protein